jgi:hypothetical protein
VDGIRLDLFQPGVQYDLGNCLGALFLSEGWAVPVETTEPAMVIPISELAAGRDPADPQNLRREVWPPYFDAGPALALHFRRRSRTGSS